jgi:peroxiredoxin
LTSIFSLNAQQVEIAGNAPEYAGQMLKFHVTDNYISNTEIVTAECVVASNGDFKVGFSCAVTRETYLYLGIFKAMLFVEPNMSYRVLLPPRTDKTPEQASTPFFEEISIYLSVTSATSKEKKKVPADTALNLRMIRFDEAYNPVYEKLAMDAMRRNPVNPDSIIRIFEQTATTENAYFNDYVTYRTGMLYYATQQASVKRISGAYFSGKPVLYNNVAYMDLFHITYKDYFMYFGRTKEGQAIYELINVQKNLGALKRLLGLDGIFSDDSLLELVILKNIYDEFYSDRFSRQSLLDLLDSIIEQSTVEKHKEIGRQIRAKITKLLRGFAPPAFSLYNQDSSLVSLNTYKGKYVYLMFCTTQNYVCLSQYELLKELYKIHHKWLRIVVISVDDHFENMRAFRRTSGYLWDYLHYANQPDVIQDYDVRIFPTCFLINPEGKLIASPAPDAADIERSLFNELTGKGLWYEYIKKGWIIQPRKDNRFEPNLGIPEN